MTPFTNQPIRRLFPPCFSPSPHRANQPEWPPPPPPFQIADNLYYVGSQDLAAFLVTTPAGNILINANLESSAPLIRASVEVERFFAVHVEDTREDHLELAVTAFDKLAEKAMRSIVQR